ncbi:MAG: hypothetical protein AABY22_27020 [Nanoarchaeota archaeon]
MKDNICIWGITEFKNEDIKDQFLEDNLGHTYFFRTRKLAREFKKRRSTLGEKFTNPIKWIRSKN